MERKKELLRAYARANDYKIGANFAVKEMIFSKDDTVLTEAYVLGSEGFAGFCDGYQGRPHRYKRPQWTPERNQDLLGLARSLSTLFSADVSSQIDTAFKAVGFHVDYDDQFKKGRACAP